MAAGEGVRKLGARVPLGFWAGGAHTSAAEEAGGGAKGWGFRGGDVREEREGDRRVVIVVCVGKRKRKLRELGRFAFLVMMMKGKHLAQVTSTARDRRVTPFFFFPKYSP